MEQKIIQYAFLKTIYDKTSNLLDCFYPFFINSLKNDIENNINNVKDEIKVNYNCEIPIHVINKLAKLAEDKKHVILNDKINIWPIQLTEIGKEFKDNIEKPKDVERRINQLVNNFKAFLANKKIDSEINTLKNNIENFIKKNTNKLSSFFFEQSDFEENITFEDHERELIEYILETEKSKPDDYKILKELFYGSIISSSLSLSENIFDGIISSNFKSVQVYFDANFLFSLLGYHGDEFSIPAKELYNLLLKYGFHLTVYDFTILEMNHVLINYIKNENQYPSNIKIKSLYSELKRRGLNTSDIFRIISNLEEDLKILKINKKHTNLNIEKYDPINKKLDSSLWKMKPQQSNFYHNHDIMLLEKAANLRKQKVFNFEKVNSLIITSDFKITKLCYLEMGHKSNNSISEIILDRTMTNLLFLKNPKIELSLATIISGFSSELFIKNIIWEKFYKTMKKLRNEGRVSDDMISNLFYHCFIEKELIQYEETDIDIINDDFVLKKIEEASNKIEFDFKNEKEKRENDLKKQKLIYEDTIDLKDKELQNISEKKDLDILLKFDNRAKILSNRYTLAIRFIFGIVFFIPVLLNIIDIFLTGKVNTSTISIIRYLAFLIDIVIPINKIWEKLNKFIYNLIFNKYKKIFF